MTEIKKTKDMEWRWGRGVAGTRPCRLPTRLWDGPPTGRASWQFKLKVHLPYCTLRHSPKKNERLWLLKTLRKIKLWQQWKHAFCTMPFPRNPRRNKTSDRNQNSVYLGWGGRRGSLGKGMNESSGVKCSISCLERWFHGCTQLLKTHWALRTEYPK